MISIEEKTYVSAIITSRHKHPFFKFMFERQNRVRKQAKFISNFQANFVYLNNGNSYYLGR